MAPATRRERHAARRAVQEPEDRSHNEYGQVRTGPFAFGSPSLDRSDRLLPVWSCKIHRQGRVDPIFPPRVTLPACGPWENADRPMLRVVCWSRTKSLITAWRPPACSPANPRRGPRRSNCPRSAAQWSAELPKTMSTFGGADSPFQQVLVVPEGARRRNPGRKSREEGKSSCIVFRLIWPWNAERFRINADLGVNRLGRLDRRGGGAGCDA